MFALSRTFFNAQEGLLPAPSSLFVSSSKISLTQIPASLSNGLTAGRQSDSPFEEMYLNALTASMIFLGLSDTSLTFVAEGCLSI